MAVLQVKNLTKKFGSFTAVNNISFELKEGEILGLLGPNGAGKTTAIQMLLGITTPNSGNIYYFGKNFFEHPQFCLSRLNFTSAFNNLQGRTTVAGSHWRAGPQTQSLQISVLLGTGFHLVPPACCEHLRCLQPAPL